MDIEKVLLRTKHLLEEKYGGEAGIFIQQRQVMLEKDPHSNPIIPEEVEEIVKQVRSEFHINPTDFVKSVTYNGTILVGFASN